MVRTITARIGIIAVCLVPPLAVLAQTRTSDPTASANDYPTRPISMIVPFAPALIDLVGGQVHSAFSTVAASLPFIKDQRLRPLGVTTLKRSALFPNLPTISESGLPGYEMGNWVGVVAPANTPKDVVNKLNGEIALDGAARDA